MKNNWFLGICLCAVAAAGLTLVSCEKDKVEKTDSPVISVSAASLSVSGSGGSCSFSYSVDNPASDGNVTCSGSVTWLSDFSVGSGTVTFEAAENKEEDARTGTVTLSYYYTDSYGLTDCVLAKVSVVQDGGSVPSLELETEEMTASAAGGVYSFDYTLRNAYSTEGLDCTSDADWISDYDYSTFGTIAFTVDANEGSAARTAIITVTYDWDYSSITREIILTQTPLTGDVTALVGRYLASGYAFDESTEAPGETTWYMTIYEYDYEGASYALIDGLTPVFEGYYPSFDDFVALGYLQDNALVIPTQLTGSVSSYGYVGWTPCVGYGYSESAGGYDWYYDYEWPVCSFAYDEEEGTWTSDYGEFCALFLLDDDFNITSYNGFYDVTLPGVVITKLSDESSLVATPSARIDAQARQAAFHASGMTFHPIDEGLRLHAAGSPAGR